MSEPELKLPVGWESRARQGGVGRVFGTRSKMAIISLPHANAGSDRRRGRPESDPGRWPVPGSSARDAIFRPDDLHFGDAGAARAMKAGLALIRPLLAAKARNRSGYS